MKRSILFLMLSVLFLTSCSSHKSVLYTMEDRDKPEWASLSKTVWEKGDTIYSVGYTEGNPKSNMSALAKIADNNARTEIVRLLSSKVGVILENNQFGDTLDNSNFKFYGTEESLVEIKKLQAKERYYEKVALDNGTDIPDIKYEFYSLVAIKKSDFKKAMETHLWKNIDDKRKLETEINKSLGDL